MDFLNFSFPVLLQNDKSSEMDRWFLQLSKASVTSGQSSTPVSPTIQDPKFFSSGSAQLQPATSTDQQKSQSMEQTPFVERTFKHNHHHGKSLKANQDPPSRRSIFRKKPRSSSGGEGGGGGGGVALDVSVRLDSWFRKRPSIYDVKEKGIHKGGNVFGADLDQLVKRDAVIMMANLSSKDKGQFQLAPAFVIKCIEALGKMIAITLYTGGGNAKKFLADFSRPKIKEGLAKIC